MESWERRTQHPTLPSKCLRFFGNKTREEARPPIYNCNFEKVAWTIPQRPETHTAQQAIQKCACPGMRSVLTSVSPGARLGPWRHISRADLRGGNPHGKNHAPCMISGISTRKAVLDGKISAPRIPNRLIAPGNGHMRRGFCHHYLEKHT